MFPISDGDNSLKLIANDPSYPHEAETVLPCNYPDLPVERHIPCLMDSSNLREKDFTVSKCQLTYWTQHYKSIKPRYCIYNISVIKLLANYDALYWIKQVLN